MKRITISLPEEDVVALMLAAQRSGMSVSAFVRKALAGRLSVPGGQGSLPFAALGRSRRKTTAQNAEEILAREWRRR